MNVTIAAIVLTANRGAFVDRPFVLLADDNEATCTLIAALLHPEFDVEVATDGAEAIEKLKARQYAAILLDLLMPTMDGYAVLDFLRAERPDVLARVLVVTAALSPTNLERVRGYGVCGVVAKPFEVETLLQAVRGCAGSEDAAPPRGPLLFSGSMILLLADFLRQKLL
jgi:CheY-like chemotaxis protein